VIFNTELIEFYFPGWALIITGFLVALAITLYGIPVVVRVARIKNLYDIPGKRTSHFIPTPRLGGIIIFASVILPSVLFTGLSSAHELKYIIAGMIILAFLGLKDDIINLSAFKKAIGQFVAAFVIVVLGDIHLSTFTGLLNNPEFEIAGNLIVTILVVMTLINSINFVDGIDGLAAGIGIITSIIFGSWNLYVGQTSYAVICFALSGALLAFFYFNVFSRENKIFLGDTGSMLIGFLLSVLLVNFLETNTIVNTTHPILKSAPAIALSILFVPVFDTMRICLVRIYNGKSIFKADSNHVHHRVLRFSGSHLRATVTILSVNLLIILITYLFRDIGSRLLLLMLIVMGILLSILLGSK
jgi:UDP-GlcNAc:undecaprenyl-phosphate/decaprenyl-phosphate GlcNAc-1-phosphate transferase